MPDLEERRHNAEWRQTFRPRNLSELAARTTATREYLDAAHVQAEKDFQQRLETNKGARDVYFKTAELRQKADNENFKQQQALQIQPLKMQAEQSLIAARAATEKAALAKAQVAADTQKIQADSQAKFYGDVGSMIHSGVMPGTPDFHKGVLAISAYLPGLPKEDREKWVKPAEDYFKQKAAQDFAVEQAAQRTADAANKSATPSQAALALHRTNIESQKQVAQYIKERDTPDIDPARKMTLDTFIRRKNAEIDANQSKVEQHLQVAAGETAPPQTDSQPPVGELAVPSAVVDEGQALENSLAPVEQAQPAVAAPEQQPPVLPTAQAQPQRPLLSDIFAPKPQE